MSDNENSRRRRAPSSEVGSAPARETERLSIPAKPPVSALPPVQNIPHTSPNKHPIKEKHSKWIIPLLIIIIVLLLFISACSAILVAINNPSGTENLLTLFSVHVTPEPTSTPAPTPVPTPVPTSTPAPAKEGSEFERVLLKKGSLIQKEFIDCCLFEEDSYFTKYKSTDELFGFTDTLKFQTASILDVETGRKVYALRITTGYYTGKYNYGEAVGVMDADEIDGAIQTLKYIKQNISNMTDYSEVLYTASSGMELGAYHSSSGEKIYVKVNSNATKFYPISKIDSLIAAFEKVHATLIH